MRTLTAEGAAMDFWAASAWSRQQHEGGGSSSTQPSSRRSDATQMHPMLTDAISREVTEHVVRWVREEVATLLHEKLDDKLAEVFAEHAAPLAQPSEPPRPSIRQPPATDEDPTDEEDWVVPAAVKGPEVAPGGLDPVTPAGQLPPSWNESSQVTSVTEAAELPPS